MAIRLLSLLFTNKVWDALEMEYGSVYYKVVIFEPKYLQPQLQRLKESRVSYGAT